MLRSLLQSFVCNIFDLQIFLGQRTNRSIYLFCNSVLDVVLYKILTPLPC